MLWDLGAVEVQSNPLETKRQGPVRARTIVMQLNTEDPT